MSSNIQRLGNMLARRMKSTAHAAVPMTVELGTIGTGLSLTTDSLRSMIPRGEYMASRALIEEDSLKAGDRVLVAWCGNEPVVISVVVGS